MKKGELDKETLKKRTLKNVRTTIVFFILLELFLILFLILTGTKMPLKVWIFLIAFLGLMIISSLMGYKFRERIIEPKTQNTLGYIVGGLACLQIVLYLIADILEGKINAKGLIISGIIFVCFLIVGIILVKKSKKKA
ncbi:MAG: hypothetical protein ABIE36_03350 [Candidatus Diapherotrites archaeon]